MICDFIQQEPQLLLLLIREPDVFQAPEPTLRPGEGSVCRKLGDVVNPFADQPRQEEKIRALAQDVDDFGGGSPSVNGRVLV